MASAGGRRRLRLPPRSARPLLATSPHRSHRREPGLGMAGMLATAHPRTACTTVHDDPPGPVGKKLRLCPEFVHLPARVQALPAARPLISRLPEAPTVCLVGGAVRDLLVGDEPVRPRPRGRRRCRIVRDVAREATSRLTTVLAPPRSFSTGLATTSRRAAGNVRPARSAPRRRAGAAGRRSSPPRFTVNAIAIPISGERAGELRAAPRRARGSRGAPAAGSPRRELHRRPDTAVPVGPLRQPARLRIEPHTRALAEGAIAAGALDTVSGPRIGAELRLLAREPDPGPALSALADLGLYVAVHPAFGLAGENETLAPGAHAAAR